MDNEKVLGQMLNEYLLRGRGKVPVEGICKSFLNGRSDKVSSPWLLKLH